jgi:hypothetical protein
MGRQGRKFIRIEAGKIEVRFSTQQCNPVIVFLLNVDRFFRQFSDNFIEFFG